jgi:hypothetical protein
MRYILFIAVILFSTLSPAQRLLKLDGPNMSPTEPSIAVKKDSGFVVGTVFDDVFLTEGNSRQVHHYRLTSSLGVYGDPVLHRNDTVIYYTHLSKTAGKEWGDWFDRIVVQKSLDHGESFNDGTGVGFNEPKMQDKPWMSSFLIPGSPLSYLYLTWTEFDSYGSDHPKHRTRIMFSSSADGISWTNPVVISDVEGDARDGDSTVEGATTISDQKGNLYAAWAGMDKIFVSKSTSLGKVWGKPRVVAEQKGGWNLDIPHVYRTNAMPFMASIDQGPVSSLFIVFAEESETGEVRLKLLKSVSEGGFWDDISESLNAVALPGCRYFFPNICTDPSNGKLHIVAYEQSYLGFIEPILFTSSDRGATFKRETLIASKVQPPLKGYFFGDYMDVDAYNGIVRPVFVLPEAPGKTDVFVAFPEEQQQDQPALAYFLDRTDSVPMFNFYHPQAVGFQIVEVNGLFNRNKTKGTIKKSYTENEFSVPLESEKPKKIKLKIYNASGDMIRKIKVKNPLAGRVAQNK